MIHQSCKNKNIGNKTLLKIQINNFQNNFEHFQNSLFIGLIISNTAIKKGIQVKVIPKIEKNQIIFTKLINP